MALAVIRLGIVAQLCGGNDARNANLSVHGRQHWRRHHATTLQCLRVRHATICRSVGEVVETVQRKRRGSRELCGQLKTPPKEHCGALCGAPTSGFFNRGADRSYAPRTVPNALLLLAIFILPVDATLISLITIKNAITKTSMCICIIICLACMSFVYFYLFGDTEEAEEDVWSGDQVPEEMRSAGDGEAEGDEATEQTTMSSAGGTAVPSNGDTSPQKAVVPGAGSCGTRRSSLCAYFSNVTIL